MTDRWVGRIRQKRTGRWAFEKNSNGRWVEWLYSDAGLNDLREQIATDLEVRRGLRVELLEVRSGPRVTIGPTFCSLCGNVHFFDCDNQLPQFREAAASAR